MKTLALFLGAASFMFSSQLYAAMYLWDGASGLFPNQVSPAMSLLNGSSPEIPQLNSGVLTLANDSNSEYMLYHMSGSDINMPSHLSITANVRMVSSDSSNFSRAGAMIGFATAFGIGNALWFSDGEIFLGSATETRGPSALVNTTDSFHTYRIEVFGLTSGSSIQVFQDESLKLTGNTYSSVLDFGALDVRFGEESNFARGNSQWTSFSHNAAVASVPEPSTVFLSGIGFIGLIGTKSKNAWRRGRQRRAQPA